MTFSTDDTLWREFLQVWPLERLFDQFLGDTKEKYGPSQSDFYQLFATVIVNCPPRERCY